MDYYSNVTTLEEHRLASLRETLDNIDTYGKALVVRHTGYGKSFILTNVINTYKEEKHLVLVPSTQLKEYLKNELFSKYVECENNVNILLYQNVASAVTVDTENVYYVPDELKGLGVIHLDELHRAGANTWGTALLAVIEANPNAKLVGYTATPDRMDLSTLHLDILSNNAIEDFSITDSIANGFIPPIKYVSALYSIEDEYAEVINKINKYEKAGKLSKGDAITFKNNVFDNYYVSSLKDIICEYIPTHSDIDKEMKFVVFLPTISSISSLRSEIEEWFTYSCDKLGLAKSVELFELHGELSSTRRKEVMKDFAQYTGDSIKLLLTVNLLNEGVHFEHLTGVIMLRGTQSSTLYLQQLGRCIHPKGESPIVFDFVSNYAKVGIGYSEMVREVKEKNRVIKYTKHLDIAEAMLVTSHLDDALTKLKVIENRINERIGAAQLTDIEKLGLVNKIFAHMTVNSEANKSKKAHVRLVKACSMEGRNVLEVISYMHSLGLIESFRAIESEINKNLVV